MGTFRRHNYDEDGVTWNADAYTVDRYEGVAWHVLGWETEPDDDTEWTGIENRTGNVLCIMVGDDRVFSFDPDNLHAISEDDYCPECGQIGCTAYKWSGTL